MDTILITSIGTTTAINLLKLLHQEYRIIAVDTNEYGFTAGSLMADAFYKVCDADKPEYVDTINKIIDAENVKLVIPIHDKEEWQCSLNAHNIHSLVLAPNFDVVELFQDKYRSSLFMANQGFTVARFINKDCIHSKCIYRKKISVASRGIRVFNQNEVPVNLIHSDYEGDDYFLQEYIDGEEYTVDVACDKRGIPFVIIPRKRIEVKAGVATKTRIIKDETLIQNVKTLYSQILIPGFSNVQFIFKDNKYHFIELNCRYGGMSIASSLASYNYPKDVISNYIECTSLPLGVNGFNIKWNSVITRYYEEQIYEA